MDNISTVDKFPEYRLLEAYCCKRRPRPKADASLSAVTKLRKTSSKDLPFLQSASKGRDEAVFRCAAYAVTDEFEDVADQLTHIVDSTPLFQDDVVKDGVDNHVIQRLVELLKKCGDELNEEIQKDRELMGYLQNSFSYTVFENVASAFVGSVVPTSTWREEASEQKAVIAWTVEMTSRLTALDLQPMNRVMGFGAQYLHQHFAPWIQQHGGWNKVFNSDDSYREVQ
ncbi:apoptosis facilitator Bcl-2-like protein 14 [Colossoma macropomum]|uniref:apoptosis facilitator Bcl-2-like protein 14 n=1 Tax=Colossoma macropomum TaxID=42526 RepID=UPI0018650309|nr:apoptosis facilitator Bcl-2-like protein 14 [Colossoma macropomum]XP_036441074.1 apoptosis facilitator Bcl-2-like protein 14 [Colossoma macropomum]